MKIVVSARAYSDPQKIYLIDAALDQALSEKRSGEIHRHFMDIARFPAIGRHWPGAEGGMRRLVIGQHLIFYRADDETVLILRVLGERMDVEAELLR